MKSFYGKQGALLLYLVSNGWVV